MGVDMVRIIIIWMLLLLSCSPGRKDGDGDADNSELDLEEGLDALDARDVSEDRGESDALEFRDVLDATEEVVNEECSTPIRDCGPGCRQVTCLAYIGGSETWDVSNDIVAYYSYHRYNRHGVGLYMKNLSTEEETKILSYSSSDYKCWYLALSQNRISYDLTNHEGTDNFVSNLHLFDLTMSDDVILLSSSSSSFDYIMTFNRIDMYGDIIVWNGKDVGDVIEAGFVYMFDLSSMERTKLIGNADCYAPRIWNRNIVCEGWWSSYVEEVAIYNLDAGGDLSYLNNHPAAQINPDIWENRVVWVDFRAEQCADIYWCELPECIPQPVTTNQACQDFPAIEGDWIVWHDFRNDSNPLDFYSGDHDNIEIWGFNLSTGQEYQLASFGEVFGNRLRVEGGKLYFAANPEEGRPSSDPNAIFQVDLSQFL
jgi:beta propeller repeat protein